MSGMRGPADSVDDVPEFLIKTSLGCSLVMILILIPFTVNNFIHDRQVMGLATSSVSIACVFNVWNGLRGRYSLFVNTYLVTPTAAFTVTYTVINLGHIGSYWPLLLASAYYFVLPERRALIFNVLTILVIIPSAWIVLDQSSAVRFSAVLLGVSLFAYISMREINVLHRMMREQAVTDALTGLLNRSLLDDSLQRAIAQSWRSDVPMALITIDVDHFKVINDTLGHDKGDVVLRELGHLLRGRIRGSDVAFRAGGDEFLILAHNADEQQGVELAESIREEVERSNLLADRRITLSAGVSGLDVGWDATRWVKDCDKKLYRAKEGGRNQVVA